MGLFSDPQVKEPPKRSSREKCWEARDQYFACLDEIKVANPLDPANSSVLKKCDPQDKQFNKDCVSSWVKYFKEKRPFDIKKERMLKEMEANNGQIVQLPGSRVPPPK